MGVVLDTSAAIGWERPVLSGQTVELSDHGKLILPAIVWAEALMGVRLADSPRRAAARLDSLEGLKNLMGIEPFTSETAGHYADIFAELSRQGKMIPQNDISVAATARQFGFGVLVGPYDEAHFRRVKGLEVVVFSG